MSKRGPNSFKQRELARALRGAQAAGAPVERVEISTDGKIILVMKNGDAARADDDAPEDLVNLIK